MTTTTRDYTGSCFVIRTCERCGGPISVPRVAGLEPLTGWSCVECVLGFGTTPAKPQSLSTVESLFPPLPFQSMLVWEYPKAPAAFQELHPTKVPAELVVVYFPKDHPEMEETVPVPWLKVREQYPMPNGGTLLVGMPGLTNPKGARP